MTHGLAHDGLHWAGDTPLVLLRSKPKRFSSYQYPTFKVTIGGLQFPSPDPNFCAVEFVECRVVLLWDILRQVEHALSVCSDDFQGLARVSISFLDVPKWTHVRSLRR